MSVKFTRDVSPPHFLTVAQFCAHFAIGHTKAYELLKSGAITAKKCGARTLISTESALRWAAALPDQQGDISRRAKKTGDTP